MRAPGVLARYTTAAALARLADEGARVALLLHVLDGHRGPAFAGLLIAALMVPHVLAAPLVGALADRVQQRKPLYVAGLLGYATGLTGAALLSGPVPAMAFVLAVLAGCCAPLLIGGLTSLLGELAADRLPRAFGLDATSYSVAGIVGPALAAVIAGWAGALWAIAALVISCLLAAALVAGLPIPDQPADRGAVRSADRDCGRSADRNADRNARSAADRNAERSAEGFADRVAGRSADLEPAERPAGPRRQGVLAAMWRRPALAAVTAASAVSQLGLGALPIVAALIATQLQDASLTGWALSAMAAGNLVSSVSYARRPIQRWRAERMVLAGTLALTVPFAVLPLASSRWATLLLFAVAGVINGPLFASLLAVRDREAPPAVRTQVFTVGAGLKVTAAAAGVALAGLTTGRGATVLLLGVAGWQVLAAALGSALLRRR